MTTEAQSERARHCTGCGRPSRDCDGRCRRALDPPRFCPTCGRRMAVQVTPTGFAARCRDCGPVAAELLPDA